MKKHLLGLLMASLLTACGSDTPVLPPPPPPPPPAANVTATGEGDLVLHPSLNPAFVVAMDTPIRITETAGGSANWNYARMSLRLNGVEVERAEVGAAALQSAGFGRIGARSSQVYNVLFRFNSSDFDAVDITLGFEDVRDGRSIVVPVPLGTFTDVTLDFSPRSLRWSKLPM